ncbi:AI-2E family transporter [Compostimonas suwonensis]|uniref:Putative PurR-regulated permease PerM n=1 Tax=Compostimonas suwonensis TaxID=1048394 RepID=A0A2M9BVT3_9MICO|nr:AI-2E family transporter [Compostimonas suwonensis]PJJ62060.1 putative PurR-regulated permease PerM [Compostimonas suwonensis]
MRRHHPQDPATGDPAAVAAPETPPSRPGPFLWGYIVTLGAVGAVITGLALYGLRSIIFSIFLALFATVALDPLVRWFERRHFTRAWALVTVILLIVAFLVAIIWVILPFIITQIQQLAVSIPAEIQNLRAQGWFDPTNEASNGVVGTVLNWIASEITDPKVWAAVGSGAVGIGLSIIDGITSGFFIAILTIYFIGTYDATKQAAYRLISASKRPTFTSYAERILRNFGKYLSGMVILAFFNAVFSTILLLLAGVPGAFLIGIVAFFITLIPLIGTVLTTIGMTIFAFIHSPVSGLVVLVLMLIYMQVEAYVLTPKVMSKAVQIPGSVVLISALAGGTLFGLPGALVAIPISAGVILIITDVVMPRKERS